MDKYFNGYKRKDGSVGIRNKLLIISITGLTGPTSRKISSFLQDSLFVDNPYGGGVIGDDNLRQENAIIGFCKNPNIAAVLIISADPPKGNFIKSKLKTLEKPVILLTLDECNHDGIKLFEKGLRAGAKLIKEISNYRREKVSLKKLIIGLECGRSDPSSGIISNPIMGLVSDKLVYLGGSVILGETIEWLGAEHLLIKRAVSNKIKNKIMNSLNSQMNYAKSRNINLLGNNPGFQNIEAGLSTIEEKFSSEMKSNPSFLTNVLPPTSFNSINGLLHKISKWLFSDISSSLFLQLSKNIG